LLDINITLLWQFIPFLISWFFLSKFLLKPMLSYIYEREELIDGKKKKSKVIYSEIEEKKKFYNKSIEEAQREAKVIKDKIHQETLIKQNEIIAGAKSEAQEIIAEIQEKIKTEYDEAVKTLETKVVEFSQEIENKLLTK